MINSKLLNSKMKESGFKRKYIADQLNLSYQGLRDKITGKREFVVSEVKTLKDILHLNDQAFNDIFFA